jgi:hypothetical protein
MSVITNENFMRYTPTTQLEKKVRFDGTINLGHVITFVALIASGMVTWSTMDKRVTVLEEARLMQTMIDKRQDDDRSEMKKQQREDNREINAKLDRLIERGNKP